MVRKLCRVMQNQYRTIRCPNPPCCCLHVPGQNGMFIYPVVGQEPVGSLDAGPVFTRRGDYASNLRAQAPHQVVQPVSEPTICKPAARYLLSNPLPAHIHPWAFR